MPGFGAAGGDQAATGAHPALLTKFTVARTRRRARSTYALLTQFSYYGASTYLLSYYGASTYQVTGIYPNFAAAVRTIYATEGLAGFYAGQQYLVSSQ